MSEPKVSLFASAVRPKLWPSLLKSLENSIVNYEIVFAGPITETIKKEKELGLIFIPDKDNSNVGQIIITKPDCKKLIRYIKTENIKPAQCYEIARRQCTGEVVVWIADDAEFVGDILGKAYNYWKSHKNEKLILSLQTKESGYGCKYGQMFNMKEHTFYSLCPETTLMAPLGMMSRKFLDELGGLDQRYVCGQYENDIVMRAYQQGASVEIFGSPDCYVDIDHLRKSIEIGESTDEETFRERPFATGYAQDRLILENSWTTFDATHAFKRLQAGERPHTLREVSPVQLDEFQGYPSEIPLTYSLSNKGKWS
jgi:hypothetical protein